MEKIGRYRVMGELGRGAMGVVYRAEDPAIGRTVAIKTIKLGELTDSNEREFMRERLRREARSAGILSHPGIVTIYDIFEEGDTVYVLMEYVNGKTLEKLVTEAGCLPKDEIFDLLRQTAAALDYAHEKGIVHRDIKPANIMISLDGQAKITDFGVAKILSQQMTQTRSVIGTPYYMSPEQIQGGQIEGTSDQFALAVIAFELMTGERPYSAESLPTLLFKIVQDEAPPPDRLNPSLAAEVGKVFGKAFRKEPGTRFRNCTEFVNVLVVAANRKPDWAPVTREVAGLMATARAPKLETAPAVPEEQPTPVAPEQQPGPFGRTNIGEKTVLPPMPKTRMRGEFPEEEDSSVTRYTLMFVLLLAIVAGGVYAYFEYFTPAGLVVEQTADPAGAGEAAPEELASSAFPAPPPPAGDTDERPGVEQALDPPAVETAKVPPAEAPEPEPEELAPPVAAPPPAKPKPVPAPVRQPKAYWVQIRSNPRGALVTVDNDAELKCKTPCEVPLAPGRHTLNFDLAGHGVTPRVIQVPGITDVTVNLASLASRVGTLAISSRPPGASIFINGRQRSEKTPAMIKLPPGDYRIGLSLPGHPDHNDKVTVRSQGITSFSFEW